MSKTLENVKALIGKLEVRISDHGYDELSSDNLLAREVVEGVSEAVVVEVIQTIRKAHLCWCVRRIAKNGRYMLSGEYRKGISVQRY